MVSLRVLLLILSTSISLAAIGISNTADCQTKPFSDDGDKSTWHDGFERYDYELDCATSAIAAFKRPANEGFGMGGHAEGKRRCIVICPTHPAAGNPWLWRGCYWDHQPQTEIEMLRRGFHVAYISADSGTRPDKYWDTWYEFLTEKHGLSQKPCFIGMSRGGEFSLLWASAHPQKVTAIYADNPGGNDEIMQRLPLLAKADVPLLLVCGSIDPILTRFALPIENLYQQNGGRVSMMLKDGAGHHPHSLNDPKPIADFLERSFQEKPNPDPDFASGTHFTRSSYYSVEDRYELFPKDAWFISLRGPIFAPRYNQYEVPLGFSMPVTIIEPISAANGMPWVLRAGSETRNNTVDQALLALGFHIVVGPVGFNADGPDPAEWERLYKHLVSHGFSKKPVLEAFGAAAQTVFLWASNNSDKVSAIYSVNPVINRAGAADLPKNQLAGLARAAIPLVIVAGSLDPSFESQTRTIERKYRELSGKIDVFTNMGDGHYPLAPRDYRPVIARIQEIVK